MMDWLAELTSAAEEVSQMAEAAAPDTKAAYPYYRVRARHIYALREALRAIPDEDPMVVLLKWLDERDASIRRRIASCEKEEFVTDDLAWNEGRLNIIVKTIRRIEEMGYKLPEEGE